MVCDMLVTQEMAAIAIRPATLTDGHAIVHSAVYILFIYTEISSARQKSVSPRSVRTSLATRSPIMLFVQILTL